MYDTNLRNQLIQLVQERPDLKPLDLKEALRKNDLTYDECVERFGKDDADTIFGKTKGATDG